MNKYLTVTEPYKMKDEDAARAPRDRPARRGPVRRRLQPAPGSVPAARGQPGVGGLRRCGRAHADAARRAGRGPRPRPRRGGAVLPGDHRRLHPDAALGVHARSWWAPRWPSRRRSSPSWTPRSSRRSAPASPTPEPHHRAPGVSDAGRVEFPRDAGGCPLPGADPPRGVPTALHPLGIPRAGRQGGDREPRRWQDQAVPSVTTAAVTVRHGGPEALEIRTDFEVRDPGPARCCSRSARPG